jgi:EAL domain-containing protein (putative c-di-GMP-specific phosphodiesterase class I)
MSHVLPPSSRQLPVEPADPRRIVQLFLWFPMCADLAVTPWLDSAGFSWSPMDDDRGLRLVLPDTDVSRLVLGMTERLSADVAAATKVLRLPTGVEPSPADLGKVSTLRHHYLLCQSRWLSEIMQAKRLSSHFQPIVHALDTSRIFAYEALLRGRDAHENPIPPLRLIQAARESGMMRDLELEAQSAALRGLLAHGLPTTVFVNINPVSLGEASAALAETRAMIDRLGIPRQQVVFEIVEMDSIVDTAAFGQVMREFQTLGFRFALDDLGSGYSGLNLVHQLKPDFIKLDMALVRNVHTDAYKAVITQMVLELARRLGLKTIAEGVETLGELDWLRQHGVDYVQGYLIAKPASPPATSTPAIATNGGIAGARVSQAG